MRSSDGHHGRAGLLLGGLALFLALGISAQGTDRSAPEGGAAAADPGDGPTQPPRHEHLGGAGRPLAPLLLSGVTVQPRPLPTTPDGD